MDDQTISFLQSLMNQSASKQGPSLAAGSPMSAPFDPSLEVAAQPNNIPMHPMVSAIMQRLRFMSMLRNRSNQNVVDPGSF